MAQIGDTKGLLRSEKILKDIKNKKELNPEDFELVEQLLRCYETDLQHQSVFDKKHHIVKSRKGHNIRVFYIDLAAEPEFYVEQDGVKKYGNVHTIAACEKWIDRQFNVVSTKTKKG